jgi:hypothetical protein
MYLLRGGKIVKLETTTLAGDRNQYFVELYNFSILSFPLETL